MTTIKVRVVVTVEVDVDSYRDNYGIGDPKDIRDDVRGMIADDIDGNFDLRGVDVKVVR